MENQVHDGIYHDKQVNIPIQLLSITDRDGKIIQGYARGEDLQPYPRSGGMTGIHHRMPLILYKKDMGKWLFSREEAEKLL